ncbi:MAG TPA: STAS domain-containing protein, partial [Acidimicrobiia bacterium]|nr:STAS domain-containing protein [Acidimicrobiia bacterium]
MEKNRYRIEQTQEDGVRRLALSGELDMNGVSALLEAIQGWEYLDQIVIDTTDLEFIESVGLAALVSIRTA